MILVKFKILIKLAAFLLLISESLIRKDLSYWNIDDDDLYLKGQFHVFPHVQALVLAVVNLTVSH